MEEDLKVLEEFITRPHIYGTNIPRIKNCIKILIEKYKELEAINKMQEYRISVIDERELIPKSALQEILEDIDNNQPVIAELKLRKLVEGDTNETKM